MLSNKLHNVPKMKEARDPGLLRKYARGVYSNADTQTANYEVETQTLSIKKHIGG